MNFTHEKGVSHYIDKETKLGYLLHVTEGRTLTINTVFVYDEFRNQGVASKMMHAFYDYLKESGLTVIPVCPYAVMWFKRNKNKVDVLDPAYAPE